MALLTKVQKIELEFNEPFADIIIGFAEMGYSRTLTAEVLGINLSYFRQLCKTYDVSHRFKPQSQQIDYCRGKGVSRPGWPKGKSRTVSPRYTEEALLREIRRFPSKRKFELHSTISPATIIRRFGSWKQAKILACLRQVP